MAAVEHQELVDLLCRQSILDQRQAAHVVQEVLAYFGESPVDFVRRRHLELQAAGLSNKAIYAAIQAELPERRFAADTLTERQIRRAIYG